MTKRWAHRIVGVLLLGLAYRGGADELPLAIVPETSWAWSESAGWIAPKGGGGDAAMLVYSPNAVYLRGYLWAENIGWISLSSSGQGPFANTAHDNWGVNVDASWMLQGYAFSEAAGWINFNVEPGVTVNWTNGAFDGYAWSESLGWISWRNTALDYGMNADIQTVAQGVPYWWMWRYGLTNDPDAEAQADGDGDGVPTWQEFHAQTDPVDGEDFLRILSVTPTDNPETFFLTWRSVPGVRYAAVQAEALDESTPWTTGDTQIATNASSLAVVPATQGEAFFFLRVLPK